MVLDRLFLWVFTVACLLGTAGIILRAPSIYDMREPIDPLLYQQLHNANQMQREQMEEYEA